MTKISIFRTTFIWVETVPAILDDPTPVPAPYSFLGRYGGYAAAFDDCMAGRPAIAALKLPWDGPQGNFFWKYYFEGKQAGAMTGVQAWRKLVPFRLDQPPVTVVSGGEAKFNFEAFYFPHGIAVVARANYRGQPKSALEIAQLATSARYDYKFAVEGSPGPATGVNLDAAAERLLAFNRKRDFGNADGFPGDNQPFSVTTFLVGENVTPLQQGSDEHFLLETVTSWNRNLKPADLAGKPLADASLVIRGTDNENIMYSRDRGRAIWLPRIFANDPNTSTLACYHRNVTQASVQTLSLGEFVSWVAAQFDLGVPVALQHKDRAKRAAELLRLLNDGKTQIGKKVTYRTASVLAQIENAGWTRAMDLIKALPDQGQAG